RVLGVESEGAGGASRGARVAQTPEPVHEDRVVPEGMRRLEDPRQHLMVPGERDPELAPDGRGGRAAVRGGRALELEDAALERAERLAAVRGGIRSGCGGGSADG